MEDFFNEFRNTGAGIGGGNVLPEGEGFAEGNTFATSPSPSDNPYEEPLVDVGGNVWEQFSSDSPPTLGELMDAILGQGDWLNTSPYTVVDGAEPDSWDFQSGVFGEFFGGCSPAEDPGCGDTGSGSVQGADCAPGGSGDLLSTVGPDIDQFEVRTGIDTLPDGSSEEFLEVVEGVQTVISRDADGNITDEDSYVPGGSSVTIFEDDSDRLSPENYSRVGVFDGQWGISAEFDPTGGVIPGHFSGVIDGRGINLGAFNPDFGGTFTETPESIQTAGEIRDVTATGIPELGIEFSRRLNELSFFQIYAMDPDVRTAMIVEAGEGLDANPELGGAVAAASSVEDLANNTVVQNVILGSISGNQVSAVMTPEQVIALAHGAGVFDDPGSVEPDVLRGLVAGGMWDGLDEGQRLETFPLLSLDLVPQGQLDQTGLSGEQVAEIVTEIVALSMTSPDPVDLGGATRLINEDDLQGTSLWQHGQPILSTADLAHIVEFDPGVAATFAAHANPDQLTQETWEAVLVATNSDLGLDPDSTTRTFFGLLADSVPDPFAVGDVSVFSDATQNTGGEPRQNNPFAFVFSDGFESGDTSVWGSPLP